MMVVVPQNSLVMASDAAHNDDDCDSDFALSPLPLPLSENDDSVDVIRATVVCNKTVSVTTCFFEACGNACRSIARRVAGSEEPCVGCHRASTVPLRVMTTDSNTAVTAHKRSATCMTESTSSWIASSVA